MHVHVHTCIIYMYNVYLLVVIGALEVEVNSADEALGWLEAGNTARVTAATQMNQRSSRSHAVFTLHIGEPIARRARFVCLITVHMYMSYICICCY